MSARKRSYTSRRVAVRIAGRYTLPYKGKLKALNGFRYKQKGVKEGLNPNIQNPEGNIDSQP